MAQITNLIQHASEDLESFLRAYEFELFQRRAAERAAAPAPSRPYPHCNPTADGPWASQLRSTRACAQTKL